VTILTDHKNLEYFAEKCQLSECQICYAEHLSKFQFKVVYCTGVLDGAADALSHIVPPEEGDSVLHDPLLALIESLALQAAQEEAPELPALTTRIQSAYGADTSTSALVEQLKQNPMSLDGYALVDGILFHEGQVVIPANQEVQCEILVQCHDSPAAGHFGIQKTFELVSRTYEWPDLRSFVKKYVSTCDTCLQNKTSHQKPYGFLQSLPIPETPWSSVSMDFIVQLPPLDSFTAILVVINHLTKMAHFALTTSDVDAAGMVSLFLSHVVATHGVPDDIVSDHGSTFAA